MASTVLYCSSLPVLAALMRAMSLSRIALANETARHLGPCIHVVKSTPAASPNASTTEVATTHLSEGRLRAGNFTDLTLSESHLSGGMGESHLSESALRGVLGAVASCFVFGM